MGGTGDRWISGQHAAHSEQRESLRRKKLWQGQEGEIAAELEGQTEAKQETVRSGEASDVDHFDLTHEAADAVDMENRRVHVE